MTDNTGILLSVAWLAIVVIFAIRQRRRDMVRLRDSFDALRFDTPEGPVRGDKLLVVKQVVFQKNSEGGDSLRSRMAESFWYCVAPGQSYWLAMPMRMSRKGDIQWVVRPLTEERMRAALIGDRRALDLAFGA